MAPTVIIVGAGRWQVPLVDQCRRMGFRIIAVDVDENAPGMNMADLAIHLDAHEPGPVVAAIEGLKKDWAPIVGVVTKAARGAILTTAHLARALGVPGISPKTAELTIDRGNFRDFLVHRNFPHIRYTMTADNVDKTANGWGWPVVVKPSFGSSGSLGVTLVETPRGLEEAFVRVKQAVPKAQVIIEEYIDGLDLGVLGLMANGKYHILGITQRKVLEAPHFLPDRYWCPWEGPVGLRESVQDFVSSLVDSLEITVGPVYVEMRVSNSDGSLYAIEVEPSLPAHISERLIPESSGQDPMILSVRSLLGEDVVVESLHEGHAGCQFIYAPYPGQIRDICVNHDDKSSIRDSSILRLKEPGGFVEKSTVADAVAIIYAKGSSRLDLDDNLTRIQNQIRIEMS